ncbi:MAG: PhoH family protein [Acidobacteria bacterium]|nr:PhoH family protein [Acidobacteriota bacterium]
MAISDAGAPRKTYVVDTSILVSAPDALQNLTTNNTVVVPFPVLQELDRRRTAANGIGYTARNTVRFLDGLQSEASLDQLRSGIPLNGGLLKFHSGTLDMRQAWPGFNSSYADDAIILLADMYQQEHTGEQVILVTRDAAMRCKARARAVTAEDYWSDRPVPSPEKFYSGRLRIEVPEDHAGLLSALHHEQRLPIDALAGFTDVTKLLANQCCELHVAGNGKCAWGIYKNHDTPGYLRRVNTKSAERFGPCNAEQSCARDLILDEQTMVVSLVGMAGTGKTLIALLSAYELLRSGKVSRIEVYRLNAEAGRELGFLPGDLGEKMAPWAKPIIDNLDFIMRRLHGSTPWTNRVADHHVEKGEKKEPSHPTVENLLQSKVLEIAPINYLRGRSIHDAAIIVDDGQNLTQEDMKLVLTRAGEGSRVILTGDPDQIDRAEINSLSNGLVQVVERFKGEACFAHLTMHEVVRSRIAEMAAKLL